MARESKRKREARRFGRAERLIDGVGLLDWSPPHWFVGASRDEIGIAREAFDRIREDIADAVPIDATNVCEYLFANSTQEEWVYSRDFPCCAPPFGLFFIEMSRPSRINSEGVVTSSRGLAPRWGWLFSAKSRDQLECLSSDGDAREAAMASIRSQIDALAPLVDMSAIASAARDGGSMDSLGTAEKSIVLLAKSLKVYESGGNPLSSLDDLGWVLQGALLAITQDGGAVVGPLGLASIEVGRDGRIAERKINPTFSMPGAFTPVGRKLYDEFRHTMSPYLFPAMLAISFMNCKNVTLEAHDPDARLNHERQKAGLKPFLRYHTINIEPMKRALRSEGGIEHNGLKKALHICRGHFATYTDRMFGRELEKPVTVWRPAHVRGSSKQGLVVSDYRVSGPGGVPQ